MYHEEKIINGVLCYRSSPNGEWHVSTAPHAAVVNTMAKLSNEQRLQVLSLFCINCGCDDPYCWCGHYK